jgi:hypothetical protein
LEEFWKNNSEKKSERFFSKKIRNFFYKKKTPNFIIF